MPFGFRANKAQTLPWRLAKPKNETLVYQWLPFIACFSGRKEVFSKITLAPSKVETNNRTALSLPCVEHKTDCLRLEIIEIKSNV